MKANMPVAPAGPKTARLHKKRPRHRCRRCPYYGPWGQCFDRRRKSGRCGDWVWYMRGAKQWRHLYVKPRDPRTPAQRYWRAKFGAASRKYSQSLTQAERRACIAAGHKLRSRPRLGQSGPLNGQHYAIRRDYSTRTIKRALDAKTSRKPLQTKGHSRSTSDRYRTTAGPLPKQHASNTRRAGNNRLGRAPGTPGKQKPLAVSRLHRRPRVTLSTLRSTATEDGSTRQRCRRVRWPARQRAGSSRGTALALGRAA